MQFVGRNREFGELRRFLTGANSSIGVLYGRRRVGKSFLIKEALKGTSYLFLEGLEKGSKRDQITHFVVELHRQIDSLKLPDKPLKTWKEALLLLFEAVKGHPRPIVLDEFQWMANYRHELVSHLKYVWDNFFANLPGQKLILCGSIASFMMDKVIKSSALYGRIDLEMRLSGFSLKESGEMLPGRGTAEILEAHLLTSGVPKYLQLLGEHPSIQLAMQQLAFTPDRYFVNEYPRIFDSHFGKNPHFEIFVRALAEHPLGLSREQLAQTAGVAPGGQLTRHLKDLESAGFIGATASFNKAPAYQMRYFLKDAYTRFYLNFILPNIQKISSGKPNRFAGIAQSGAYYAWMGRSFEYTCMQHANLISSIMGFSGIDFTVGPYFASSKKGRSQGVQIDLVFDRPDNVITLCEMKYSNRPVGVEIIQEVERKVELLETVAGKKTIHRVLIVKELPSRELVNRGYFYRIIEATELFQ